MKWLKRNRQKQICSPKNPKTKKSPPKEEQNKSKAKDKREQIAVTWMREGEEDEDWVRNEL